MPRLFNYPFYEENAKWFCSFCGDLTTVELNPEWVKAGKPMAWDEKQYDFEWFSRCSVCGGDYSDSSYGCETCGFTNDIFEFYYYFDEKTGRLKDVAVESYNNLILPKEVVKKRLDRKGIQIYPIYGHESFGHEGDRNWEETHFCPYCRKEYSFTNGS